MKNNVPPPPAIPFISPLRSNEQTHPGLATGSGNNYREKERESISTSTAKPVQQIIALQINLRERRAGGRCCPIFSVTILCGSLHSRSPQRVPEYMGGRYTQTSPGLATWTRHLRPGIPLPLPHGGRKKTTQGRQGKKWSSLRGSWYLLVASGSLPSALLRLVIARGCEQKKRMLEKEKERCICVGKPGRWVEGKVPQKAGGRRE